MSIDKVVGDLYQLKSSIKFDAGRAARLRHIQENKIEVHVWWDDRYSVTNNDILVLVKPDMDLTTKTFQPIKNDKEWAIDASMAVIPTAPAEIWKRYYDTVRKQWEENKRIPGSAFLTPTGNLIWISDIDLKYFEIIELNSN